MSQITTTRRKHYIARRFENNAAIASRTMSGPTLAGHLKIARIDHWVKNVFVLPGVAAAMTVEPWCLNIRFFTSIAIGMLSVCVIASSNYVINELLDASSDRWHPTKCRRPVPTGEVNIPLAFVQWIAMFLAGMGLALTVSLPFAITMAVLWLMGCIYNIPPLRSKDKPYLDVLSESVNNPLRLLAGWFMVGTTVLPPASLLMSYWMIGCYFMAIKRYAELRDIDDTKTAANYRRSFAFYNTDRLLVSIMFYASTAMLFLGAFTVRYRLELILAYPLVAVVMAIYLWIGLKPNSAAQAPEKLHREPMLMASVIFCALVMGALMAVDIPGMHRFFAPTMPVAEGRE
ncbi:MAG: UbiA prenyltransferase family protein [Thermoguttaceae bacterium]|jgi:4-hydroxybenzoate polyprenyltransferase